MSYRLSDGLLLGAEGGEQPNPEHRPHFPMTPVVLAMFSPVDLPIWGGASDSHRVVSAEPDGKGRVRLDFGHRDEPSSPVEAGYAIVDLELGIVREMRIGGVDYATSDVRTVPWAPLGWE